MTKKIIEIENISKKYALSSHSQKGYNTLKEAIAQKFKHPFTPLQKASTEEFFALNNVSFSVEEGDRLGIVGRNGAGKSTLLKILSRVVEPTFGKIKIRGRVSSLLEVGTGFHPELTGRENIFLNGAILGMSHQEIKQKFDDIVAFAEVEKFLDTPVKRYSSGMYMRLGFAIAAHLDPDLFIVDEVLAVGDAGFQEKCLKKLNSLSHQGKTVLFVSHDISSIVTLCNKGVFLEKGQVKEIGSIDSVVNSYMQKKETNSLSWSGNLGDEHVRFFNVSLINDSKREFLYKGEKVTLKIEYEILKSVPDLIFGIVVWNQKNQRMARTHTCDLPNSSDYFKIGKHTATFELDTDLFYEGDYTLKVDAVIHNIKHIVKDQISLKMPIFVQNKDIRFTQSGLNNSIYLGNRWQLKTGHNS